MVELVVHHGGFGGCVHTHQGFMGLASSSEQGLYLFVTGRTFASLLIILSFSDGLVPKKMRKMYFFRKKISSGCDGITDFFVFGDRNESK